MLCINSNMSFNSKNTGICLFDIESTGLKVTEESILEICFIDYTTEKTILHIYVYPSNGKKITNSHIHKIDEEVLKNKNAITIKEALLKINSTLKEFYDDKLILLTAHNNFGFDQLLLESEYYRCGLKPLENILYFDSLPFIRHYFDDLNHYGLGKLYEIVTGVKEKSNDQLHTAEFDTKCLYTVLARIFTILIKEKKLKINLESFTRMSIFNKKYLEQDATRLSGVKDYMKLKKKGIKNINGLINIFKCCGENDKFFKEYMKTNFKIKSVRDINRILKQIKYLQNVNKENK